MKARLLQWITIITVLTSIGIFHYTRSSTESESASFSSQSISFTEIITTPEPWRRPDGPPKVGLQVGHWKNSELPDELRNLRERGGGTSGGGTTEWEVNLAIAELVAEKLRAEGIIVDILPATVPPSYWADVFVSIHADGNESPHVSGYKVAAPWRDQTGLAQQLASMLEASYAEATRLILDPNITRNMRGYYAFNSRRYTHSIHPMTVAAIVETGFLTNPSDQQTIIHHPERSAEGIVNGIQAFLESQSLLPIKS